MVLDDDTGSKPHHVISSTDKRPASGTAPLSKSTEESINKLADRYPDWGPERLQAQLARMGESASSDQVRKALDTSGRAGRKK